MNLFEWGWNRVSESLPESGTMVLAVIKYKTLRKIIRAMYVKRFTLEDTGCEELELDYNEAEDTYYLPVGWYEVNENEDTNWTVVAEVTHWRYLPDLPEEL